MALKFRRWLPFLLSASLSANWASGELRLTYREAQYLVEQLPEMLDWQRRGGCPVAHLTVARFSEGEFQGRRHCNVAGVTNNINHYIVNLFTGRIRSGLDLETEYDSPALSKIRAEVLRRHRERLLTDVEAACLTEQTLAGGSIQGLFPCPRAGVFPVGLSAFGLSTPHTFTVVVENRCEQAKTPESQEFFRIDRYSGMIEDARTGTVYDSAKVVELRENLLASHRDAELSIDQAKSLVEHSPVFLDQRRHGSCPEVLPDTFAHSSSELWFTIRSVCASAQEAAEIPVTVNVYTGAVIDPKSRHVFRSEALEALQRRMLEDLDADRSKRRKFVNNLCQK